MQVEKASNKVQLKAKLGMQVEKAYNKVLDGCAHRREDMAAVSDKISLGTAVRTLWEDAEEEAVTRCSCRTSWGSGCRVWGLE